MMRPYQLHCDTDGLEKSVPRELSFAVRPSGILSVIGRQSWRARSARTQSVNLFEEILLFCLGAKHIIFPLWLLLYCCGKTVVFSSHYGDLQPLLPEPDDALVAPLLAPSGCAVGGCMRARSARAPPHTVFLLRRKNTEERVRTNVQSQDRDVFPFLVFFSLLIWRQIPHTLSETGSLAAARSPPKATYEEIARTDACGGDKRAYRGTGALVRWL